jgi:hypothetical protein
MGRELRRVPLDFTWPLNERWAGFVNPHYSAVKCAHCDGTGYSPTAKRLADQWYGYAPFRPEDRGSVPLTVDTPAVRAFAERNVSNAPEFYGRGEAAIVREAKRLSDMWNQQWSHHLNADDVAALVEAGRLMDLTHTWSRETRWVEKSPPYVPSPAEVNEWSISSMGHDSINQWVVLKAECIRLGVEHTCERCHGEGDVWPSKEAEELYESWEKAYPPVGDGYQIWETVSEGSPISPVFSAPEELARHMATTSWGADKGTPYEAWLAFINGPGWAPSAISGPNGMVTGVQGVVA